MCRALSFYAASINGSAKVWISEKTDSHSKICDEFKLKDTGMIPLFAGEFYPDDKHPTPDVTKWEIHWDGAATNASREAPTDAEFIAAVRKTVEREAKKYVWTSDDHEVSVRGWAFDSATITTITGGVGIASNNATIKTITGGVGNAYGNATITNDRRKEVKGN